MFIPYAKFVYSIQVQLFRSGKMAAKRWWGGFVLLLLSNYIAQVKWLYGETKFCDTSGSTICRVSVYSK